MKIRIDLNTPGSLEAGIAQMQRAINEIRELAQDIVTELSKTGADIARVNFAEAEYAGDHADDVGFKISGNGLTGTVYADGNAILFIEFGTGILKAVPVGEYDEIESGSVVDHGEYGQRKGANMHGWFYRGSPGPTAPADTEPAYNRPGITHTYGNDANSSMYNARRALEQQYSDIVRECWRRRMTG